MKVQSLTDMLMGGSDLAQHQRQAYKKLARLIRQNLEKGFPNQVEIREGQLYFSPEVLDRVQLLANILQNLSSQPDILKLQATSELENEFIALGQTLLRVLINGEPLRVVAPVCPDYAQNDETAFYQTIGQGISPQAEAAIKGTALLNEVLSANGIQAQIEILVADTENDILEIISRCANGDENLYFGNCQSSVQAISESLPADENLLVTTFTEKLGNEFRELQYFYEEVIQRLRQDKPSFERLLSKVGESRSRRHAKILGRGEQDYELTIRYMAQYAALGSLCRVGDMPTILVNYPTPNLPFYNAARHIDQELSLGEDDRTILPLIQTVL